MELPLGHKQESSLEIRIMIDLEPVFLSVEMEVLSPWEPTEMNPTEVQTEVRYMSISITPLQRPGPN